MMVNTNVYGYYVPDAGFACLDCAPPRDGDGGDTLQPLFYLDDEDPHGTACDDCGAYIFEPVERHTPKPDGTCDYGCFGYCGDTESCFLHGPTIAEQFLGEEPEPETLSADALLTLFALDSTDHPAEEA